MSIVFSAHLGNGVNNLANDASQRSWAAWSLDPSSTSNIIKATIVINGNTAQLIWTGVFPGAPGSFQNVAELVEAVPDARVTSMNLSGNGALAWEIRSDAPIPMVRTLKLVDQTSTSAMRELFGGDDVFSGALAGTKPAANDVAFGHGGNDVFYGNGVAATNGRDVFVGGEGIDTAVFRGSRSEYSLQTKFVTIPDGTFGEVLRVTDNYPALTGSVGRDRVRRIDPNPDLRDGVTDLASVERLQFADGFLAGDVQGHAGEVAKVLGAVFGRSAIANKEYAGIGMRLLDAGMEYTALMELALTKTWANSDAEIVSLLWTNVVGAPPSMQQAQPYVDMLKNGLSRGELGVFAADFAAERGIIDLVGLAQTGLEYI